MSTPEHYRMVGGAARDGWTRVMYLGGALDHTIRPVLADVIRADRPADSTYRHPLNFPDKRHYGVEFQYYELTYFRSGPWSWYVYVLAGHEPSMQDVIDANPAPFYKS